MRKHVFGILLGSFAGAAQAISPPCGACISTNTSYNSVFFVNANTGYVVGDLITKAIGPVPFYKSTPFIRKTTDGGATWVDQTSPNRSLSCVRFSDANHGWTSAARTLNGGATWDSLNLDEGLISLDFINADTGWAAGESTPILKTTDGGVTWAPQESGMSRRFSEIQFLDALHGWVATGTGTILRTTNGGTTWIPVSASAFAIRSLHFLDAHAGWSAGDSGTILKSTDGGVSWTAQAGGVSSALNSIRFANADNGWAVGVEGAVLKTTDGGMHWTPQSQARNSLLSVFLLSPASGWIGGLNYLRKITDGTVAVAQPGSALSRTAFTLNDRTLRYALPVVARVQASLYTPNGKLVRAVVNGPQNPGEHSLDLSPSLFPAGMYLLDFSTGPGHRQTYPLILP